MSVPKERPLACAECGRSMHVRIDGLMRKHRDLNDQDCVGGGLPPIGSLSPHVAELDAATSRFLRRTAANLGLTLTQALSQAVGLWLAEQDEATQR